MCGILGATTFARHALSADQDAVARALLLLEHRGPDDSGIWWDAGRTTVLAHRRLSILDLSAAGHQPMPADGGKLWITYNGEVYNFAELRRELELKGHRFASGTDTEVILHGYLEYGIDVVRRLRGMFAFAIYDAERHTLALARDRLGIKPLYYAWSGDTFVFASEIKAVLAYPGIRKELDRAALRQYLAFGKVYSPRTMFAGIYKFPAAHCAVVGVGEQVRPRRYWSAYQERMEFPEDAGEKYFTGRFIELFEESIRCRMISDVPVGVFLSGGVDSTANLAFMTKIGGSGVHTFTAGFRDQHRYDEREYARQAAKLYGSDHHEVEIGPSDMTDLLPELAYYLDEPVSDPTVVPIHFVSRLARQSGTIVILNGDGSDELFCGYNKHIKYLRLAPYWNFVDKFPKGFLRRIGKISGSFGGDGVVTDLMERSSRGVEFYAGNMSALKQTAAFGRIVDGRGEDSVYDPVIAGHREFMDSRSSDDYAEWLSYWGLRSEVEEIFLYRADRIGMANSVEIRVPFLDHKLVEFGMQMPQGLKYKGMQPKYIVKKALEGIVPDDLIYRKKQGFCVPIREWAGGQMSRKICEVLPELYAGHEAIDRRTVQIICDYIKNGAAADTDGDLTWMLYSLATWYERWMR